MVYAIQLTLGFRNAARRDGVAANIQAKLSLPQYGDPEIVPQVIHGDPGLLVTMRFLDQVDRDTMWADLDAALGSGVNGPVTGSRAWIHDCTHDETVGECSPGFERVW